MSKKRTKRQRLKADPMNRPTDKLQAARKRKEVLRQYRIDQCKAGNHAARPTGLSYQRLGNGSQRSVEVQVCRCHYCGARVEREIGRHVSSRALRA